MSILRKNRRKNKRTYRILSKNSKISSRDHMVLQKKTLTLVKQSQ